MEMNGKKVKEMCCQHDFMICIIIMKTRSLLLEVSCGVYNYQKEKCFCYLIIVHTT